MHYSEQNQKNNNIELFTEQLPPEEFRNRFDRGTLPFNLTVSQQITKFIALRRVRVIYLRSRY